MEDVKSSNETTFAAYSYNLLLALTQSVAISAKRCPQTLRLDWEQKAHTVAPEYMQEFH